MKKAPQLDKVRLSFSYTYPEHYWRLQDTMDFDEDYSFSEIEEMLDYERMAKREHRKTDEIRNMVMFSCREACAACAGCREARGSRREGHQAWAAAAGKNPGQGPGWIERGVKMTIRENTGNEYTVDGPKKGKDVS